MKTPMEYLLEWLEEYHEYHYNNSHTLKYDACTSSKVLTNQSLEHKAKAEVISHISNRITEFYLKLEKKQLSDTFDFGHNRGYMSLKQEINSNSHTEAYDKI